MILVRPSSIPSTVWNVVDPWSIEDANFEEGHAVALEGEQIDELIVFLKSVKPKRIVVHSQNEMLFRSLAAAFTPDKVLRSRSF
ncbi:MAG: hypothetical protein PWP76_101 [Candidatus Diapherotrites archaeon]|nr:hypothetical protein [Candidatus Diapherotrites archaeon]MDN5366795.1 hypothetical protein [Candidatus Diapherotrites archaeon]